jgi:hypothetical protein
MEAQEFFRRVRFYVYFLGGFLGIELPLIVFTYFRYFPGARSWVWFVCLAFGLLSAAAVHLVMRGIFREGEKMQLMFDKNLY